MSARRHIHLDPVGGLAGDMFLAAVLHAWPELRDTLASAMRAAGLPADWRFEAAPGASAGIAGIRARISPPEGRAHPPTGSFRAIRARLEAAPLAPGARDRAIDIFRRLAEVEGEIHGVPAEDVHFHEIADWDSVADIAGAAAAIEALGPATWSVGDLPLGSGSVTAAHGRLPVPAPATALLLRGYRAVDDGVPGERVTPTGAAILAHLGAAQDARRPPGRLERIGHGLGTRDLPGLANMLRLLSLETAPAEAAGEGADGGGWRRDGEVGVVEFEVDDQSPEDLAAGIDRLRAAEGVLDVLQTPATGKKGRVALSIRLLCRPDALDAAIGACFLQTATIGLRWRTERRVELARAADAAGGRGAKTARRPGGRLTVKADMDDLARDAADRPERERLRRRIEGRGDNGGIRPD